MTESANTLPAASETVLMQQLDVVSTVVETAAATLATTWDSLSTASAPVRICSERFASGCAAIVVTPAIAP